MKHIKIFVYTVLIANLSTTLKPVKLKLKKSFTSETQLHKILTAQHAIENYKTKSGPLTNQEKTAFNNYSKNLLQRLITGKNVQIALLETEQQSITNSEADRLYWDLVLKRLRATITQDNAHIIKNNFAQLKESALKWVLRYIYYIKTNELIDKNDLIEGLAERFQKSLDEGGLWLSYLNTTQQLESFLLYSSKILEPLYGQAIIKLDLYLNQLSTVKLSNLPNLTTIYLGQNPLTTVTLSNLPQLEELSFCLNNFNPKQSMEELKTFATKKNIELSIEY